MAALATLSQRKNFAAALLASSIFIAISVLLELTQTSFRGLLQLAYELTILLVLYYISFRALTLKQPLLLPCLALTKFVLYFLHIPFTDLEHSFLLLGFFPVLIGEILLVIQMIRLDRTNENRPIAVSTTAFLMIPMILGYIFVGGLFAYAPEIYTSQTTAHHADHRIEYFIDEPDTALRRQRCLGVKVTPIGLIVEKRSTALEGSPRNCPDMFWP